MDLEITSPANPRVKRLLALRRRRIRQQSRTTLVEGFEELVLALEAGVQPAALYVCPELSGQDYRDTVDRVVASGTEVVRLNRAVFEKVAYRESPDGWLAVVPAVTDDLESLRLGPAPLLVVCEGVEKPGNLGAILRTADAAGVSAVVAAGPVTDWGNPNLIRASKGTVFCVPVAGGGVERVLRWLDDMNVRLVATTPDTDTPLTDIDLTGAAALAVGSEKSGLSERFMAASDARARVPMFGRVNSLNVATTAAVAAYEAVRQRLPGSATS